MLDPWHSGDQITAADLTEREAALSDLVIGGNGIVIRRAGNRVIIENTAIQPANLRRIAHAEVKGFQNDYLECYYYDPINSATSTQTVNVSKPYELQRTPFHGVTITYPNAQEIEYTYSSERQRTADDGSSSETQIVTPMYWVGCVITMTQGNLGFDDGSGDPVYWEDLNTAGRHWATSS